MSAEKARDAVTQFSETVSPYRESARETLQKATKDLKAYDNFMANALESWDQYEAPAKKKNRSFWRR